MHACDAHDQPVRAAHRPVRRGHDPRRHPARDRPRYRRPRARARRRVEAGGPSPRCAGFRSTVLIPALPRRPLGGHVPALRGHATLVPRPAPRLLVRNVLALLRPRAHPRVGASREGGVARARLRARARLDPPLSPLTAAHAALEPHATSDFTTSYPKMSHVIPPSLFQTLKSHCWYFNVSGQLKN